MRRRVHPLHGPYHDEVYGFPLRGDDALFELLVLELNQAGLSWLTILKKTENFQSAFEGFEIDRVAAYGEDDVARLMGDAGIIRNRLKIAAAIHNAPGYPGTGPQVRLIFRLARPSPPPTQGRLGQAV